MERSFALVCGVAKTRIFFAIVEDADAVASPVGLESRAACGSRTQFRAPDFTWGREKDH